MDNTRYTKLTFDIPTTTTLHGFAGYFDCKLYGDRALRLSVKGDRTGFGVAHRTALVPNINVLQMWSSVAFGAIISLRFKQNDDC